MSPSADSPDSREPSAPPPRSWFRLQFSLGTLFWLMLVAGMGALWWKDRRDMDRRIQKLEQIYAPQPQVLWSAADVLGAPDDPTGGAGKSWCPAGANSADWVEVGFDSGVAAATIDLYETYSVGCVTEVVVIDGGGTRRSIWKGMDPLSASTPTARTGLFKVPVPASVKSVAEVLIHVDSTARGSWACLDAVGLTTPAGQTTWATSSTCSSVYGSRELTATSKSKAWYHLW